MIPEHVSDAFSFQSKACADLGSPFMEQLCGLFAERKWRDTQAKHVVSNWVGNLSPSADSVPLRMAGALHALHLTKRAFEGVYPPENVTDDVLWGAVCDVMTREDDFICEWIKSAPQTNEVRRSAAILAAGHVVAKLFGLPLRTSELGASGGLNLKWDQYGLRIGDALWGSENSLVLEPDWTGLLPPKTAPIIASRAGVDLNPLDPTDPTDALRLQAYLWPDQPDRLERTRAAIAVADGNVDKADAIDWLSRRMAPETGTVHFIYHTVAWQYFPDTAQAKGRAMIEAAGAKATPDAPIAWFGLETDGKSPGGAMTLRVWPGDVTLPLGRADYHGRWIDWTGET